MGFNTLFNILKLIGCLPITFTENAADRIAEIIAKVRSMAGTDNLDLILTRLERDHRFRAKLTSKLTRAYRVNAKYRLVGYDMISARERHLQMLHSGKRSGRADVIVLFSILALITCVGILLYYKNSLNGELTLIFASIISFCSSILTDASLFEFGNNILRVRGRR